MDPNPSDVLPSGDKTPKDPEVKLPATEQHNNDDKELDDLLESALSDFDKHAVPVKPGATPFDDPEKTSPSAFSLADIPSLAAVGGLPGGPVPGEGGLDAEATGGDDELLSEAFDEEMDKQAQLHFQEALKLMQDDPGLAEQFEKLAATAVHSTDSPESQKNFTEVLQSTLDSLSNSAKDLQGDLSDPGLLEALSGMSMNPGAEPELLPMMQNMMQALVSKDVLYPSLKEITEKYPAWLTEHESSDSAEQMTNYRRQYELMTQICAEFEAETTQDSDSVKQTRLKKDF